MSRKASTASLRLGSKRLMRIDLSKTGSQPYLQFYLILIIYETPRQGWLAEGFRFTSNASHNFRVQIPLCPLCTFCLWPEFVCGHRGRTNLRKDS